MLYFFQDDILPKLMAGTGSHEDLFKKEMAKYDPICQEIAKNIEAQEQLLLQIQASYLLWIFTQWNALVQFIHTLHFLDFITLS